MPNQLVSVALAGSILLSGGAVASTVNVNFDGGKAVDVRTAPVVFEYPWSPSPFISNRTAGVWQENGINTSWQLHSSLEDYYGVDPTSFEQPYFQNLSTNDPGPDPFVTDTMVISRQNGGLFDLLRIGSGDTYEGEAVYASFNPAVGSGLQPASITLPILGPSLQLTGTKADGSVVTGTGTTKTPGNWDIATNALVHGFEYFSDIDVIFSEGVLAAFTNLKSLTLQAYTSYSGDPESQFLAVLETLSAFEAPDILTQGFELCGASSWCTIEGLGDFYFDVDLLGRRNDTRNVWISDFDLRLVGDEQELAGGDQETPAPVPLPASALFLIGGIGALSLTRLRRRKH